MTLVLALAFAAFAQTRSRLAEYAVILKDSPVARTVRPRTALTDPQAQAQFQTVRKAQSGVLGELARRKLKVTGTNQFLLNAVFVMATPEEAAQLASIAGVERVTRAPRLHLDLDKAVNVANVPAAWSALGGAANAGAGIKIGIIDSGIDQTHPAFQGPAAVAVPAGFPKGDTAYTNSKVIVARSYIEQSVEAFGTPDDTSPRDHLGHGTAIAMIAAGEQVKAPAATIQGVAPGAFLGSYKVAGSPGITDYPAFSAVIQALEDAVTDGMDIVTMSMSESDTAYYGPLDYDPSPNGCGGACDTLSQAVEAAVAAGTVVVVPAGNDGTSGVRPTTLNTIESPGVAPSAITVGATMNAHQEFQTVRVSGLPDMQALFGDGPKPSAAITAKLVDVSQLGNDGLACSALPAGSLAGAIALVERGTCFYSDKIANAQNAGAIAVVIYQSSAQNPIYSSFGAQDTGIPAVMIGNGDGVSLKSFLAGKSFVAATLDPAFTPTGSTASVMWPSSSRGPSPGNWGLTPTTVIKPEVVAPGADIYTATQRLDPSGDGYNASGYAAFSGTSFSVPFVAGSVALVKQKNPALTPAQLKSAVVNTAKDVLDGGVTASVNAMGAGQLSAGDAVGATATIEPATISFGPLTSTTVSISRNLKITNLGSSPLTLNLTLSHPDSLVQIPSPNVTIAAGQSQNVTVRLSGNRPATGSYEGFIVVSPSLRVPYQYLVGSGVPADLFCVRDCGFSAGIQDGYEYGLAMRAIDSFGVPVVSSPVLWNKLAGDATQTYYDPATDRLGDATYFFKINSTPGDLIYTGATGSFSVEFDGFVRPLPAISTNGVVNAASGQIGQGLAPGSYAAIYGNALSDALQVASTAELPVSLSQVAVMFTGGGLFVPGHIYFVSPGQIDVQIPWEFAGQSSVTMQVMAGYLPSATYTLPLAPASPGIFEIGGFAAAEDVNYAVIGANHPAQRGQPVAIFVNGLGAVSNPPASGVPTGTAALSQTSQLPTVTIGGVDAHVDFAGLTPSTVGLYQINLTVPPSVAAGNQPIVVSIGGVSSKASVLPVQ
jgi:uncharacterized protein (TIGR03437 family)